MTRRAFAVLLALATPALGGERLAASTYDDEWVATGQRMDRAALTAAHRTIPFGTRLTVSFRHRKIVVTINDRGPAEWTKRAIDFSPGAAAALDFPGTGKVTVEPWPPMPKPRPTP